MIRVSSPNEREVLSAVGTLNHFDPDDSRALTAVRLIAEGYPWIVAGRVALTPPLAVITPADDDGSRPGRELAEAIDRRTPDVVRALLSSGGAP